MTEAVLSEARILTAAEEVLRRHGVDKTNVVDIARMLGISHANIYRHFPSKKALLDAVAARWLEVVTVPLKAIAIDQSRPASDRFIAWFEALRTAKQKKVLKDPELFRVYHRLAVAAGELAAAHVDVLRDQLERIIADGIENEEFPDRLNAKVSARACLQAMATFTHPAMLLQGKPPTDDEARAVLGLLLAGLRAGAVD